METQEKKAITWLESEILKVGKSDKDKQVRSPETLEKMQEGFELHQAISESKEVRHSLNSYIAARQREIDTKKHVNEEVKKEKLEYLSYLYSNLEGLLQSPLEMATEQELSSIELEIPSFLNSDKAKWLDAALELEKGRDLFANRKFKEALFHFQNCYELRRIKPGDQNDKTMIALEGISNCYQRLGLRKENIACLTLMLKILKASSPLDLDSIVSLLISLYSCYSDIKLFDRAQAYIFEALTICNNKYGQECLLTLDVLSCVASNFLKLGEYEKADKACQEFRRIYKNIPFSKENNTSFIKIHEQVEKVREELERNKTTK